MKQKQDLAKKQPGDLVLNEIRVAEDKHVNKDMVEVRKPCAAITFFW